MKMIISSKRILSLLLAAVMCFGALGCVGGTGDTSTPVSSPDESPALSTPINTPVETPAATPEETPAATPEETPAATPEETPAVTPEETPAATPEETPAATPEETPAVTPEETPAETPSDDIIDASVETIAFDDYCTELLGISADSENIEMDNESILEIVTVGGVKYFRAIGVGQVRLTDGEREGTVEIEKAKINLVVVMGQSNSGNHFDNATSDITNPIGTAYWWGNGQGLAATAPVNFTHATKGFHSTLLAELYAQSVAAGSPEKNVLVWHEGGSSTGQGTSKNGSSITGWASSATDASGTDFTVQLVNKCAEYYEARSDHFEIVSKGVYWIQGEGDGVGGIDPVKYMGCFMAMWNKLKSEAGLEYIAIMRVRKGGDNNQYNNDVDYSTTVASQFYLANNNPDIYMATTITENFIGSPTTEISVDIRNYIRMMEIYGAAESHNDKYGNTATFKDGILTTPMKTLYGSNNRNHYGKFGYTLIASDAAYNMYRALHGSEVSFVRANLSGLADEENQQVSPAGATVDLDISSTRKNLSFRACPGSVGGTLSIKVESAGEDITDAKGLLLVSGLNYGSVYTNGLKRYEDVKIILTYTTVDGAVESVTYNVITSAG